LSAALTTPPPRHYLLFPDPEDFLDLVISSSKVESIDRGSLSEKNDENTGGLMNDNFFRSNFENVVWELKACRQLLTVNTYMGNDLQQDSVFAKIMEVRGEEREERSDDRLRILRSTKTNTLLLVASLLAPPRSLLTTS